MVVLILDDDVSVHHVWQGRFDALQADSHGIEVVHVSAPAELRKWAVDNASKAKNASYLLDYELLGYQDTGLSLAEELGIGERVILVTSRYDEPWIMDGCRRLRMRLIPKGLAGQVPIKTDSCTAILIDDDELVRTTWKIAASGNKMTFRAFSTAAEFLSEASAIDRRTAVYIDAELGGEVRGDEESLKIHKLGFGEIYLATGHDPAKYAGLSHLRCVVGKEPPWGREG